MTLDELAAHPVFQQFITQFKERDSSKNKEGEEFSK